MKKSKLLTTTILILVLCLTITNPTMLAYAEEENIHKVESVEALAYTRVNNETITLPVKIDLTFKVTDYFKRLTTTKLIEGSISIGDESYVVDNGWATALHRTNIPGIKAFAEGWCTGENAHFIILAVDVGRAEDGNGILMKFKCGFKHTEGWYYINGTLLRYKLQSEAI